MNRNFVVPARVAQSCKTPAALSWLANLPHTIDALRSRWDLQLEAPFDTSDVSCAWVARAVRTDGTRAVLKLAMPHFEADHEMHALELWNGNPSVRLLCADVDLAAMLLERCEPGTPLRQLPEAEQDRVIAGLLRRLWRPPPSDLFRPLSAMLRHWEAATSARRSSFHDAALLRDGLALFEELSGAAPTDVLLATDLHAGNVLRAQREPWLVIDPKPFVGDPAFDATQHLLNCRARLFEHPDTTIRHFADLLQVSHERVRLWTFARVATEPGEDWPEYDSLALARLLAP